MTPRGDCEPTLSCGNSPSGEKTAPERALSKQSRTKRPFGRQNLARRAILASKKWRFQQARFSHGFVPGAPTQKASRPEPLKALACDNAGAPGPIRTADTRFRKPVLYPLSYEGVREDILPSTNSICHGIGTTSSCWLDAALPLPSRPGAPPAPRSRDDAQPRRARQVSCRYTRRPCARRPFGRAGARASRTQRRQ